jgi:hypothetical protein
MAETIATLDFGVTVNAPCAGIAFSRPKDWDLKVVMYFSHVVDGIAEDLEITFERAFALTWHEEALHSVSIPWPKPLPTLAGGKWDRWTYPFLQIYQSEWIKRFDFMPQSKGLGHIVLVSMNDIIEVVASPAPRFRWLAASEA